MTHLKQLAKYPLFLGACFLIIFLFILFASQQKEKPNDAAGYVQLIENISLPILLSGDNQQLGLELQTLIQNTLIDQVRVFDENQTLLLRVQNPDIEESQNRTTTRRQILFENSLAGVLEVDVAADSQRNFLEWVVRSFITSLALFAALITAGILARKLPFLYPGSTTSEANPSLASETSKLSSKESRTAYANGLDLPSGEHLLIFVRQEINSASVDTQPSLDELENFNSVIADVMEIYDAEFVASAPGKQLYCISGRANTQRVQQALMLAWGITKLAEESTDESLSSLEAACVIFHQKGKNSFQSHSSYASWTTLESQCPHTDKQVALLSESLHRYADENAFQLEVLEKTDKINEKGFLRIIDSAAPIKRLWEKQRDARRSKPKQ